VVVGQVAVSGELEMAASIEQNQSRVIGLDHDQFAVVR
jgi:hypothetical protein